MATTGVKSEIVETGNKLTGVGSEIAARSSQLKENIVHTLEDKMGVAEDATMRAIKRGRRAAEDLLDEATYEVKRRPVQSVGPVGVLHLPRRRRRGFGDRGGGRSGREPVAGGVHRIRWFSGGGFVAGAARA